MQHAHAQPSAHRHRWLTTGREAYLRMLEAIGQARRSIRLETYIYLPGYPGDAVREALLLARERGVEVSVLLDAWGSVDLPRGYLDALVEAGGRVRFFNPLAIWSPLIRNHRKLLVCDGETAFIGGFNISPEEAGDGVTSGWADLGMEISGPVAAELAASFDSIFDAAGHHRVMLAPPRTGRGGKPKYRPEPMLLANGPLWRRSPLRHALVRDFRKAKREILLISAYFLPTWGVRRALIRAARRGCRVRIVLAGKSDVPLSHLAGRHLYRRFLRAGIEIYEYQPQILHTKLMVADQAVHVGSANLDARSLNINCELLVRTGEPAAVLEARRIFRDYVAHSRRILPNEWAAARGVWQRLKENVAYFLLARLDPYFARRSAGGGRR